MEQYSFTKLTTFEECPYQFYKKYIKKDEEHNNAMAEFGSFCHSLLEDYYNKASTLEEIRDRYSDEYYDNIVDDFPLIFGKDYSQDYYDQGAQFFAEFQDIPYSKLLGVEHEVNMQIDIEDDEPFLFKGFIDLMYVDEHNRLVIHDWKSKSGFKSKAEQASYARQLYMYSKYAIDELHWQPDILRFYCFRKQQVYDIPFNPEVYEATWTWAKNLVKEIRTCEIFEQQRSYFMCNNLCDFRLNCVEDDMGFRDE